MFSFSDPALFKDRCSLRHLRNSAARRQRRNETGVRDLLAENQDGAGTVFRRRAFTRTQAETRKVKVKHKSIGEQYAGWCKHFTGISDKCCKKGIAYESVRDSSEAGPYRWPCLKDTGCKTTCALVEFPTQAEADAHEREWQEHSKHTFTMMTEILKASEKLKKSTGYIICTKCGKRVGWSKSNYNGHIHAACETPNCFSVMQ